MSDGNYGNTAGQAKRDDARSVGKPSFRRRWTTFVLFAALAVGVVSVSPAAFFFFFYRSSGDGAVLCASAGLRTPQSSLQRAPVTATDAKSTPSPRKFMPRVIWQTYKSKPLPEGMPRETQDTWRKLNPGWEVRLLDDADVDGYVASAYPDYVPSFRRLPLAVMRADIWRLMVIAREGGVYADADVECKIPIEAWLPQDCQVVLGLDWHPDDYLANFFFAAVPGHPLMRDVVGYIINKTNNTVVGVDHPHVVHETAGPAALTEAVLFHMGLDVRVRGSDGQTFLRAVRLTALMGDTPLSSVARLRNGVCLAGKMFLGQVVMNHGGSQHDKFLKTGWTDWRKERERVAEQGGR